MYEVTINHLPQSTPYSYKEAIHYLQDYSNTQSLVLVYVDSVDESDYWIMVDGAGTMVNQASITRI